MMKVKDLINKLNEIGYDENTELTFSCVNGSIGEWYEIPFKQINYGEDLTGEEYCNDIIDIEVDMDSVEEYIEEKTRKSIKNLTENLIDVISKWS